MTVHLKSNTIFFFSQMLCFLALISAYAGQVHHALSWRSKPALGLRTAQLVTVAGKNSVASRCSRLVSSAHNYAARIVALRGSDGLATAWRRRARSPAICGARNKRSSPLRPVYYLCRTLNNIRTKTHTRDCTFLPANEDAYTEDGLNDGISMEIQERVLKRAKTAAKIGGSVTRAC